MADYTTIDRPYDSVTNRTPGGTSPVIGDDSSLFNQPADASSYNDPTSVGSSNSDANYTGTQTTQTPAGAVETQQVNSNQSLADLWITTFIRSKNWKPSAVGFNIDGQTGNAEFNDVTVRGTIYATAGEIGGWTINATTITGGDTTLDSTGVITLGTGNNIVKLSSVDATYRLWIGNATAASAPFSVTKAGAIYATSGTIGGWNLAATTLTGTGVTLSSTGDAYLAIGTTPPTGVATGTGIFINKTGLFGLNANVQNFKIDATNGYITAIAGTVGGCTLATTSIGSTTFVSGPLGSGWNISNTGTAEFQNATIRGIIRTSVFEKDTLSAVNGLVLVSKADVLAADMTAADASALTITGESSFVNNEVIRIKDGTDDEWMLVTDATGAPVYIVTRDLAASYPANTNPIWKKGTAVVSMGVGTGTKTGFILLDSSSANSPYVDIYGRNSNTYTDYTLHGRYGWLKGITDADVGLATTDVWGLYTDNAYIKGVIVANTGYIGGVSGWTIAAGSISSVNGGNTTTMASGGSNAYIAGTTGAPQFIVTHAGALTATSASITGSITATTGAIGGWVVDATSLKDAAGTVGMSSAVTIGDDIRFFAGNVTPASAPFKVTEAGALTASSADITGIVNATSGHIGSATNYWDISAGVLVAVGAGDAAIRAGQTDYDTGTGFWLGLKTGTAKLSMGVGGGKGFTWDGTDFSFKTGAAGTARLNINSSDNTLTFYNAANNAVTQLGGGVNVGNALRITLDSDTTDGVEISSAVDATLGVRVDSSSDVTVNGLRIAFTNTGSGNDGYGIFLQHKGTGASSYAMDIDKQGVGNAIRIFSTSSSDAVEINVSDNDGASALLLNGNDSSRTVPLLDIDDVATSSSAPGLRITSSSTVALDIVNDNANVGALQISTAVNSGSNAVGMRMSIVNAGLGTEYAFEFAGSEYDGSKTGVSGLTGVIKIQCSDGLAYIPVYGTAT